MSEERRRAILEAAASDPELKAELTPVIAAGFGVLPLRRLGDVLTVGCFARTSKSALRMLREVLQVEIVATCFEDALLHQTIQDAYFADGQAVNFPTFRDPGFLEDRGNAQALACEREETFGALGSKLPADRVAFASLGFRTRLVNRDAPDPGRALPDLERLRVKVGDLELAWQQAEGGPQLCGAPLEAETSLVLTEYRTAEVTRLHNRRSLEDHEVRPTRVASWPHVLHPSEVQLVGLDAEGALLLHVFDRLERFPPGQPGRCALDYHFLSYGNHMQRSIEVSVYEVAVGDRVMLAASAPMRETWGALELGRWFGLEQGEELT